MATSTVLVFFKGRRGDVISRLPSGKIVLPARGFQPRAGEEWEVQIKVKCFGGLERVTFDEDFYGSVVECDGAIEDVTGVRV